MTDKRQHHIIEAAITPRPEAKGKEWDVTIIGSGEGLVTIRGREYIKSKNGRLYLCDGLEASVPMWEGIKVYDNHLTDAEFRQRAGMRSVMEELLGILVEPRWNEQERAIRAVFKVADPNASRKLKEFYDMGILDTFGLSIDTKPIGQTIMHEGEKVDLVEGFERIHSCDLVADPAAGGGFNRLIAATQQEAHMPVTLEALEARIAKLEAALASGSEQVDADAAPEEVVAEIEMAVEEVAASAPADADPADVAQAAANAAQDVADEIAGEAPAEEPVPEAEQIRKLETRLTLSEVLSASKLPADAQALVRAAFVDRTPEAEEVKRMVEQVRGAIAARDSTGRVNQRSGIVGIGLDKNDNARLDFLRILAGNMKFRQLENIEEHYVQDRMPEAYNTWVKSGRPQIGRGGMRRWMYQYFPDVELGRQMEAATTSTMSSIVKSALNVMLASDFQARHAWWTPIVREEELDSIDAPTLVRVYGLSTLDVVDEGQAYTELAWTDAEETAAFVKRGNFVGVTLESMLLDKVNKVRAIPELLADSYFNTISARAAAVFTTNSAAGPVLSDTGALFNATAIGSTGGHVNLLTAAFSYTSYQAARLAMRIQTTKSLGGGVRLGIRPKYILGPYDLEAAAIQVVKSEAVPGSANNDPNPFFNEAEFIGVPEWTDTNNWALVADPVQFPCIWSLYYRGNRVPELFTADDETSGAMFTNDTFRYKVRMLTFRFSSTYDTLPVSDWRGLHKSNVS